MSTAKENQGNEEYLRQNDTVFQLQQEDFFREEEFFRQFDLFVHL